MLSLSIALRYLFSRTRLHAVNYVTALSAIAIAVVAMALVAVVGVYNGYVAMILDATAQVDADIVLKDAAGAVFDLHDLPDYRRQLTQAGAEAIDDNGTYKLDAEGLLTLITPSSNLETYYKVAEGKITLLDQQTKQLPTGELAAQYDLAKK